ncbi:hypothetical protein PPTG_15223 [Phytophthora nicotianae INRA-310]|uniref:Histone-lysine N-methyltransferase, H3 lysine-79 specific n=1 Tax=Phytophthora nicotianae (strain INRA-310) TaxID=761204 RepID=W2PTF3_PHYN3|nr:hypothetical protein PPTG_15223 [Phytophthora nicotianae INRA-310]ETN03906.1 hypothetical protein PPTG_15223 [Phytophthora nicotianae INRA-310]
MLPPFTDQADKLLVQLAYEYVSKKRRVAWSEVARKLRKRRIKMTPKELETRLRTLQRAHGVDLAKFPPCFFGESKPRSVGKVASTRVLNFQAASRLLLLIFGSVTNAEVRQKAGAMHENAGEPLPQAVNQVLDVIGTVEAEDILLDIGCGIGNIVAQFALQTRAQLWVGIEIRSDLCILRYKSINRHSSMESLQKNVLIRNGDTKSCGISTRPPFCLATIVYFNSFLFVDNVKLSVLNELCFHPRARFVIATEAFCPRHRPTCRSNFCAR